MATDPTIKLKNDGGRWYIVNVGWGVSKIVTLQFDYSITGAIHPVMLTPKSATGLSAFDLANTDPVKFGDGKFRGSLVNPFSKDIMRHLCIWNRTPNKNLTFGDMDDSHAVLGMLFFNLGRIRPLLDKDAKSFDFSIDIPENSSHTVTDITYWVWSNLFADSFEGNQDFPFSTGDPVTHELVWFPAAFGSSGDAANFMGHFAGSSMDGRMFVATTTSSRLVEDNRDFRCYLGTYKRDPKNNPTSPANTLNFPTDPDTFVPQWDEGTSIDALRRGVSPGLNPSAYTVNFSIDLKTLKITADHPELNFDVGG
jgi:hypothetical protein